MWDAFLPIFCRTRPTFRKVASFNDGTLIAILHDPITPRDARRVPPGPPETHRFPRPTIHHAMSARGASGPRTVGTDGSDHQFRQTVDTKYKKASIARKSLKKTLTSLMVYYPVCAAFAIGPSLMLGHELDTSNLPFAVLAVFGLLCSIASYTATNAKTFHAKNLKARTNALALLGAANLLAATVARFTVDEDKRLAWVFAELVSTKVFVSLTPGQVYPFAVSMELLVEMIGVIVPLGNVALAHALATYAGGKGD